MNHKDNRIKLDEHEEEKITSRSEDYSQWYLDIIKVADLAEHGASRGSMIIKPYGYAIWELVKKNLDERIKSTGVANVYFPLLIPERLLRKEQEHVEGFSPEIAAVTYAGGKKLKEALIIRPTSETIIYEAFSRWVRSHRDLPLLINQWVNVVRWEMRPRLFLRTTEFLWQEGHTVHGTASESKRRALRMLEVYRDFAKEVMAIPTISGTKTDNEKFAGAKTTYTLEAMMQDGKALQFATSHDLGQNFSQPFDIQFTDEGGNSRFCHQTSWGLSTRVIGALIMVHSDDVGLVLPPKIAPIQLIIVPVASKEKDRAAVSEKAKALYAKLKENFRVEIDLSDERAGSKFYRWEKKGVPLRMELGPREIANNSVTLVRRDTWEKKLVKIENLSSFIRQELADIQCCLYEKALEFTEKKTRVVNSWESFQKEIGNNNFVLAHWDRDTETEDKIKKESQATIRCIPLDRKKEEGRCVYSKKPSPERVLFARAY